jgi:beta-glucosidase
MEIKKIMFIIFISFMLISFALTGQAAILSKEIEAKVDLLLSKMTLKEKLGQMNQIALNVISKRKKDKKAPHEIDEKKLVEAIVKYKVGSILNVVNGAYTLHHWHEIIKKIQDVATQKTRLGIPVLYGIDSIHGANYIVEATIFPQNIGMAATFNPELVKREGVITAYETRASGIPWNFDPVLGLGRHPLWPRLWETYGEDPYLVSILGVAYIKGLEGKNNFKIISTDKVASCIKHYLGYSFPLSGKDRTPAWIPERMLREYFLPPFHQAILAGAHSLMINSTEINGIPVHASSFYLKKILRDEIGFEGLVVSDWLDIKNLHTRSRVASSHKEAVKMATMAGADMSMVPYDFSFSNYLLELVREGEVPESRINEAVKRILVLKYKVGLFNNPYPDKRMASRVGCQEFTKVALTAAHESITLLKNKNQILPISEDKKILVTGPNAHRLSVLNSGWTYTWQGNNESKYPQEKDTILEAILKNFNEKKVSYVKGTRYSRDIGIAEAVKQAAKVDIIVACLGEPAYCETPGNINDLSLPDAQLDLITRLAETKKPIVLVLIQGRPRLIHRIVDKVDAILMAYLPGNEGGQAIADILLGKINPSGKLPITYPKYPHDLKCYDVKYSELTGMNNKYDPEFPFGFGLSYTTFEYKNLSFDKSVLKLNQKLNIYVTIKNTGNREGQEAILLYLSDKYASITPSVKRLKRFKKITLQPGEEREVSFTLVQEDLSFIGKGLKPTIEKGEFSISIGSLSRTFKFEL